MGSNAGSGSQEVFDVRKIRRFVELMNEHELTELDLRQGDQRIRMRRGPEVVTVSGAGAPTAYPAAPAAAPAESGGEAPPAKSADADARYITSPMVGTFYSAANPESPAFVQVGDQVGPETTVCIVEAMKVFNEIPAGLSGKIAAVLLENGDPVEFGQPLFQLQ